MREDPQVVDDSVEIQIDGLIGPTHNYGDLAFGNIASMKNGKNVSHPRAAALQGLAKMRKLLDLGIPQAILPPQERPDEKIIRQLGYTEPLPEAIRKIARHSPTLLPILFSSSAMWTANAATISASADTQDHKVHITPANLATNLHRSFETAFTTMMLKKIFHNQTHFVVHDPLPSHPKIGDEGAANHSRIINTNATSGHNLFTYNTDNNDVKQHKKLQYPGRQSLLASRLIASSHQLNAKKIIFLQQSVEAVNAGAFHNDVVAVANKNVLLMHEKAYVSNTTDFEEVVEHLIITPEKLVPLADAIETYLFNAQLVTLATGDMALIAPQDIEKRETTKTYSRQLIDDSKNPITQLHLVDLQQSMANGGGPACLRLRVPLTAEEKSAIPRNFFVDNTKIDQLEQWVQKHYRENLSPHDLPDPQLLEESHRALDELTQLLSLGSLYNFQK